MAAIPAINERLVPPPSQIVQLVSWPCYGAPASSTSSAKASSSSRAATRPSPRPSKSNSSSPASATRCASTSRCSNLCLWTTPSFSPEPMNNATLCVTPPNCRRHEATGNRRSRQHPHPRHWHRQGRHFDHNHDNTIGLRRPALFGRDCTTTQRWQVLLL
jgi:hypothetical protein